MKFLSNLASGAFIVAALTIGGLTYNPRSVEAESCFYKSRNCLFNQNVKCSGDGDECAFAADCYRGLVGSC